MISASAMRRKTKISYLWIQKNGRSVPLNPSMELCVLVLTLVLKQQKQDHYAVLGLSHLRYRATNEQIKIARM